ncbi:hypothetical protein [Nocardia higoensis]|uniref:hypothetical protein n=1 Tax=Nocardia higoensis TaxID=228599 RepID=UPI0012F62496|nr:hypothetical protein [Nocardia higoensis]
MNRWDPGARPQAPESASPDTQPLGGGRFDGQDRLPGTARAKAPEVVDRTGAGRTTDLFPEEDVFARMIDRSPKRGPLLRWAPVVLGCLAAVALVAAATIFLRDDGAPRQASTTEAVPTAPGDASPATQCPAERVGNRIQGNGSGGTDSGPAVIFAFQYAYYVQRSAELARAMVAPNASVPTDEEIQQGIDSVPVGTIHCVAINPGAFAGQYRVVVTEHRPGQTPVSYNPQLVSVADSGGRTLITSISAA